MITDDPVIAQIRQVRLRISEAYDHDPEKLINHYMELEKDHKGQFLNTEKVVHREEPLPA